MGPTYFVTATDTDAGKTMTCAALMQQFSHAHYWKPVQTGSDRDRNIVQQLSGGREEQFHDGLIFSQPLSPHRAAELDGLEISLQVLDEMFVRVRNTTGQEILFIEGAGGLMVPLNRNSLWTGWLAAKELSIILVCRTGLGTINHSLLSITAIRQCGLDLAGLVFFGPPNPDNVQTILDFARVPLLGTVQVDAESSLTASKIELP